MSLLSRILARNAGAGRLIFAAVGAAVGMAIVMTAVQLYCDLARSPREGAEGIVPDDYVVIQKRVDPMLSLAGEAPAFTPSELQAIVDEPWTDAAAGFQTADFDVFAQVSAGGRGLSTSLFLESLPDEFVDIDPARWRWEEWGAEVPVILPRDYLALYNFSYAPSHGLPQLSEDMAGMVPLRLTLRGRGGEVRTVTARIAGFSSRLNTIAVPQAFLDRANAELGSGAAAAPSRVIVKLHRPGDPKAAGYVAELGYEVAGDRLDTGRMAHLLAVLTTVVASVGVVITALALALVVLALALMLQKNRGRLQALITLGYAPARLRRVYMARLVPGALLVYGAAAGAMLGVRAAWLPATERLGLGHATVLPALGAGLALTLLLIALARLTLSRYIR